MENVEKGMGKEMGKKRWFEQTWFKVVYWSIGIWFGFKVLVGLIGLIGLISLQEGIKEPRIEKEVEHIEWFKESEIIPYSKKEVVIRIWVVDKETGVCIGSLMEWNDIVEGYVSENGLRKIAIRYDKFFGKDDLIKIKNPYRIGRFNSGHMKEFIIIGWENDSDLELL